MMMLRPHALLAGLLLGACAGDITQVADPLTTNLDGSLPGLDTRTIDSATRADAATAPDTTAPDTTAPHVPGPGEPCPAAECTEDALCLGGICRPICEQQGHCNEKNASPGCGSGEICLEATSFSDACFEAPGQVGDLCGASAGGLLCAAGSLCVTVEGSPARCMQLCQYGCAQGRPCGETTTGCKVCVILL